MTIPRLSWKTSVRKDTRPERGSGLHLPDLKVPRAVDVRGNELRQLLSRPAARPLRWTSQVASILQQARPAFRYPPLLTVVLGLATILKHWQEAMTRTIQSVGDTVTDSALFAMATADGQIRRGGIDPAMRHFLGDPKVIRSRTEGWENENLDPEVQRFVDDQVTPRERHSADVDIKKIVDQLHRLGANGQGLTVIEEQKVDWVVALRHSDRATAALQQALSRKRDLARLYERFKTTLAEYTENSRRLWEIAPQVKDYNSPKDVPVGLAWKINKFGSDGLNSKKRLQSTITALYRSLREMAPSLDIDFRESPEVMVAAIDALNARLPGLIAAHESARSAETRAWSALESGLRSTLNHWAGEIAGEFASRQHALEWALAGLDPATGDSATLLRQRKAWGDAHQKFVDWHHRLEVFAQAPRLDHIGLLNDALQALRKLPSSPDAIIVRGPRPTKPALPPVPPPAVPEVHYVWEERISLAYRAMVDLRRASLAIRQLEERVSGHDAALAGVILRGGHSLARRMDHERALKAGHSELNTAQLKRREAIAAMAELRGPILPDNPHRGLVAQLDFERDRPNLATKLADNPWLAEVAGALGHEGQQRLQEDIQGLASPLAQDLQAAQQEESQWDAHFIQGILEPGAYGRRLSEAAEKVTRLWIDLQQLTAALQALTASSPDTAE